MLSCEPCSTPSLPGLIAELGLSDAWMIEKGTREVLEARLGVGTAELLGLLVDVAKERADPPVSHFKVGAAAVGESGAVYLGINMEFNGNCLNQTMHAEQFTVCNAVHCGETRLLDIATSSPVRLHTAVYTAVYSTVYSVLNQCAVRIILLLCAFV